jgi:23S rRNA (adenine2503-C2)-methyltransferase
VLQRQLTGLTYDELAARLSDLGEPRYRTNQVFSWVYRSLVDDYDSMTNVPSTLRKALGEQLSLQSPVALATVSSADGLTTKILLRLSDGHTIESVWMQYEGRQTICVSSQVGCAVGCPFCATGRGGFQRDLTSGEIVDQVLFFARRMHKQGESVTNVVFMGMGEPLANYDQVWRAISVLNDARGADLGARRFTISTAGMVPAIRRMAQETLAVGLAVSLHAADDRLRDLLVPLNRRYPLSTLIPACADYVQHTRRRVSFEYALVEGVNDSPQHARAMGRLLHGLLCHVNLIPLNPTDNCAYRPADRDRTVAFRVELNRLGISNTIRLGRGLDIQAGCGQLRSRQSAEARGG